MTDKGKHKITKLKSTDKKVTDRHTTDRQKDGGSVGNVRDSVRKNAEARSDEDKPSSPDTRAQMNLVKFNKLPSYRNSRDKYSRERLRRRPKIQKTLPSSRRNMHRDEKEEHPSTSQNHYSDFRSPIALFDMDGISDASSEKSSQSTLKSPPESDLSSLRTHVSATHSSPGTTVLSQYSTSPRPSSLELVSNPRQSSSFQEWYVAYILISFSPFLILSYTKPISYTVAHAAVFNFFTLILHTIS